jgi:HD-GYP domain-containing protein (c-di-GMP phosphodiesterase class II)
VLIRARKKRETSRPESVSIHDRFSALAAQVGRCSSPEELVFALESLLRFAIAETGSFAGQIMEKDPVKELLRSQIALAYGAPADLPQECRLSESIEGEVWQSQAAVIRIQKNRAILCVPVITSLGSQSRCLGTLTLLHSGKPYPFGDTAQKIAQHCAELAADALAAFQFYASHRRAVFAHLLRMVEALESEETVSIKHSRRVAEVCRRLGSAMGLDEESLHLLYQGALLHDLGKTFIPPQILNKPGRLTEEELVQLRRYPLLGYELAVSFDLPAEVLFCIRSHTEKLDGSGYPDRLTMPRIPLPLRILSVADAFDAMSSFRAYRPIMDARLRNEQLNRFAGTQFDPMVVKALKALLNSNALDDLYQEVWAHSLPAQPLMSDYLDQAA